LALIGGEAFFNQGNLPKKVGLIRKALGSQGFGWAKGGLRRFQRKLGRKAKTQNFLGGIIGFGSYILKGI